MISLNGHKSLYNVQKSLLGFSKNSNIPDGMRMLDWTELGKAFAKEMQGFSFTNPLEAISAYEYTYYRPAMVEKIKSKDYSLPFAADDKHTFLIGMNFSKETRNIEKYVIEKR